MIPHRVFVQTVMNFLSPVRPFLEDNEVTEVLVNGPNDIYVEKKGRLQKTTARFENSDALEAAVRNIAQYVGRLVGEDRPILEARLPDGSRVEAVLPPISRVGIAVSIRKFSKAAVSPAALIGLGSISKQAMDFLEVAVRMKRNIVIAGGTGSGKTSLLNVLSGSIPEYERIVTIEDSAELQLVQPHVVGLETRPADAQGKGSVTIRDLLRATLRLRPDRIVVGECRAGEALDMIQAMTTGHGGSLTTVHATRPEDSMRRLETLCLMSDVELPLSALRGQIASAIDIIVMAERMADGSRKITHISESLGLNPEGNYDLTDLFEFQFEGVDEATGKLLGQMRPTGVAPSWINELAGHGERVDDELSALWGVQG